MRRFMAALCAVAALSVSVSQRRAWADEPAKPAVIGEIPGPDGAWDYASVDPASRRLYIARGDGVMTVDLASGTVTPRFVAGQKVHAVLPLAEGRALSTNGDSNTATLFDAATGRTIATIPTGRKPDAALFDPTSGLVLVMDGLEGDVILVDPHSGGSPGRIAVGGKLEFAAADGRGRVFVNIEDRNQMAVIDASSRKVTARYKLTGCKEPSGLAIDPESGLLIAACGNQKAIAIDSATGRIIALPPIGKDPDAVVFDPSAKRFYVPCGGDGVLSVIAERPGAAPETILTVTTAIGARTGALDPATGKLYLPTATAKPGATGLDPESIPGSFRLLVLSTR